MVPPTEEEKEAFEAYAAEKVSLPIVPGPRGEGSSARHSSGGEAEEERGEEEEEE